METENPTPLEPVVSRRELPIAARALRDLAAAEFTKRELALQPNIDAHVEAYSRGVENIIDLHANIAVGTDLPIGTDTRWSAIWELSGRCLAECRLLIHALRGGFGLEASSNVRAVFEATDLLGAVGFHAEDRVLRRWLAGDDVRPKKARAVLGRKQALARRRMKEAGLAEPESDLVSTGEWLYRHFSNAAHHRRGPITSSISLERRQFAYGPHPDPAMRARETRHAGDIIETALMVVADALADIVGRDGLANVLAEQKARFEHVRERYPLE